MRSITRLNIPPVLDRLGGGWLQRFIASGKDRPPTYYRHSEILRYLNANSNYKCYYCERILKQVPNEVDHYVEISEHKHLAFLWENLYLSCDNCNNKLPNTTIPCIEALDPCSHWDAEIQIHLSFENEIIVAKDNSVMGQKTITKFLLDSPVLDHVRLQVLSKFKDVLIEIKENQIKSGRKKMNVQDLQKLRAFTTPSSPFSLMMTVLLKKHGLF